MFTLNNIMICVHLLTLITTATFGIFTFTRLKSDRREYFAVFIVCVVIYELGFLYEVLASTTDGGFIATMTMYAGAMLISPTFLVFVQKYCAKSLPKAVNFLLFATAFFVTALVWTSKYHTLYYTSMEFVMDGPVRTLAITRGVLYPLGDIHPAVCMVIALWLLAQKMRSSGREQQKRIAILIFCAVAPALSQLLTLFNIYIRGVEVTPFFIVASIIAAYYGQMKYDFLENEETIRIKKEFLQDLNHEMRTPLAVVATGIDLIDEQIKDRECCSENVAMAVDAIRNQVQRIGRMLDGMVEMASISESAENRQRVNFAALLRSGAGEFGIEMKKQGTELVLDIPDGLPDVFVKSDQFTQVVTNLLSNASRYAKGGRVVVCASADKRAITVRVIDTGKGIANDLLPRVFERGVSGDGGTGFGLHICKSVVEAHGGTIKVENIRPGHVSGDDEASGTVVTFTVPVYSGQEAGRN